MAPSCDHIRTVLGTEVPARSEAIRLFKDYFSTPHPGVMPSAYADGSVRGVPVGLDAELLCRLWTFNDGLVVSGVGD